MEWNIRANKSRHYKTFIINGAVSRAFNIFYVFISGMKLFLSPSNWKKKLSGKQLKMTRKLMSQKVHQKKLVLMMTSSMIRMESNKMKSECNNKFIDYILRFKTIFLHIKIVFFFNTNNRSLAARVPFKSWSIRKKSLGSTKIQRIKYKIKAKPSQNENAF